MKNKVSKIKKLKIKTKRTTKKFKQELKKSIITALVAAFGFLIALSWKDVVYDIVPKISEASPIKNQVVSALIITTICVIGILVLSNFNHENGK